MENDDNLNIFEQTAIDATEYAQLQLDKLKLRLLDNFSTLFNSIFSVILMLILGCFALMFITVAITWALGVLIGSYFIAILIMASVFILATLMVFIFRKKLIVNQAVQMLSQLMFEIDKNDNDDE